MNYPSHLLKLSCCQHSLKIKNFLSKLFFPLFIFKISDKFDTVYPFLIIRNQALSLVIKDSPKVLS
jgi:hypothetical protein